MAVTFNNRKIIHHVAHENGCKNAPNDGPVGVGTVKIT